MASKSLETNANKLIKLLTDIFSNTKFDCKTEVKKILELQLDDFKKQFEDVLIHLISKENIKKKNRELHQLKEILNDGKKTIVLYDFLIQLYLENNKLINKSIIYNVFINTDFSSEYLKKSFRAKTKISIEKKPINDEVVKNIIDVLLNEQQAIAFTNVIDYKLILRKNDVTKEISDSNSFLIDGYSLIIECLTSHNVDWSHGGQFLHLVYLFENYIQMLSSLTDHYFIVFFEDINFLFSNNNMVYLAISVIFNHIEGNDLIKSKTKFFRSFSDADYRCFLNDEKPTFIVRNEFMKLEFLRASVEKQIHIVYKIFNIFHSQFDINIMLINNLSIRSNRLHAFYSLNKNSLTRSYFKALSSLGYEKDLASLKQNEETNDELVQFIKDFIKRYKKILEKLKSLIGSKMVYYCISMVWCYIKKGELISDEAYGSFIFVLIIQCYLQDNLDLKQRAFRLHKSDGLSISEKAQDGEISRLIDLFQRCLAHLLQSSKLVFLELSLRDSCDIFDGRLITLCLHLCSVDRSFLSWKTIFNENIHKKVNNVLRFLRTSIEESGFTTKNSEFLCLSDMGTLDPTYLEVYEIFQTFFKSKNSVEKIEALCFNSPNIKIPIKINKMEHPVFEKLLSGITWCNTSEKDEPKFLEKVKNFVLVHQWNDTFNPKKFALIDKRDEDENENEIKKMISKLNVYSITKASTNDIKSNMSQVDISNIESLIRAKKYEKVSTKLEDYKETIEYCYLLLKYHFTKFKDSKSSKEFITILRQADSLWKLIVNGKTRMSDNTKVNSVELIFSILGHFALNSIKKLVSAYAKKNWQLSLDSSDENENFENNKGSIKFQMNYLSDYLVRKNMSSDDKRSTIFQPDIWQVAFLDAIDRYESIIIAAPTSSGKTYASFYAMEKVLKSKDADSFLIYVAPTKALVNQTAYAIAEKFSEHPIPTNKKLYGVFTRDNRENLQISKILVTNAQCLFILLTNYRHTAWLKNVYYVIFDEIHSMGGEEGNLVWEHLLLLIKCPFIALSATISDAKKLQRWSNDLQKTKRIGTRVSVIEHSQRHSDTKKYIYTSDGFKQINPIGCINIETVKRYRCLSKELSLSPHETCSLYNCLLNTYKNDDKIKELDPEISDLIETNITESLFVSKDSIQVYENEIKEFLLDKILNGKAAKVKSVIESFKPAFDENEIYPMSTKITLEDFLSFAIDLIDSNMLPCIIFTNNRLLCEKYSKCLSDYLARNQINLNKNDNNNRDPEIDEIIRGIGKEGISEMVLRGVSSHHSGHSPQMKAIIEALFRLGYLKIIIATATLALGVHMPCKTVVFTDDAIYLDSFQYRQASGRAGRRGYDSVGNIVFLDIPFSKVKRLISSYIPPIRPHFPLSVNFTLQFFDLAIHLRKKDDVILNSILKNSYWAYTYRSKVSQIHYDTIFSISFLIDLNLLNNEGKMSLFSDLLERIHYHEPSNFILYYLIVTNAFHDLISEIEANENGTIENENIRILVENEIMNVLCHLFNVYEKRSNKNTLSKMPDEIEKSIKCYNDYVIESYTNFFSYLCRSLKETAQNDLNILPLSKISFSKPSNTTLLEKIIRKFNYDYNLVSPFAALSGIQDHNHLKNENNLYFNVLKILHIDSKIMPLFHATQHCSNYALKFFKSDDISEVVQHLCIDDNMLIGDLFNLFKDFNVLLFNICTCINKIAPEKDKLRITMNSLNRKFEEKFKNLLAIIETNPSIFGSEW